MILYINTSGKYCELVLLKKLEVIDSLVHEEELSHSAHLHDLIKQLLDQNAISFANLSAIAVLNGPGSYTGLRIGLAAAKGFCYSLDIPLVLLNQLSILCSAYETEKSEKTPIAAIKYARAGECFLEVQFNNPKLEDILPGVQTHEYINELRNKHPNLKFISPMEGVPSIETLEIEPLDLSYAYLAKELSKRLTMNKTDDLFRSEPFYLKKVHVNTPKKRF